MAKDKKEIETYLIDIRYKYPMNRFFEMYGDSISYSDIEQRSYIDFKQMVCDAIGSKIKFRKHERVGMTLRLRVEMTKNEYEKLMKCNENEEFFFVYDYMISNIEPFNIK